MHGRNRRRTLARSASSRLDFFPIPSPVIGRVRVRDLHAAQLSGAPQESFRLTELSKTFNEFSKIRVLKLLGIHFTNYPPVLRFHPSRIGISQPFIRTESPILLAFNFLNRILSEVVLSSPPLQNVAANPSLSARFSEGFAVS